MLDMYHPRIVFLQCREGGGSGSAVAKDKVGKLIVASEFKAAN